MLMQKTFSIAPLLALVVVLAISCGDDNGTGPVQPKVPVLTTTDVSTITRNSAECGGTVTSDNGFPATSRGVCWCTDGIPSLLDNFTSDGTDTGSFASSLTGLTPNTTYHVRAYAVNGEGTGYGNTVSFTTLDIAYTVTDVQGNEYRAISIGTQVWMTENLKVTQYRNEDTIPYVSDDSTWEDLMEGALCYYNNNPDYLLDDVGPYGCLYNPSAVTDSRGLAPEGWHIPSADEWQTLIDYLGGEDVAGGKMKETGTEHWVYPNAGATNQSGFTALPGGYRQSDGQFFTINSHAYIWWVGGVPGIGGKILSFARESVRSDTYTWGGYSVRCVKD